MRPATTAQIGCKLNGMVGDSHGNLEETGWDADLAVRRSVARNAAPAPMCGLERRAEA
jgi:hypothetical protein